MEIIDLYPRTKTMVHSDMHTRNIMVQDGELLLIDMDDIALGHPMIDLSHACHCYNALMTFPNGLDYIGISADTSIKLRDALLEAYFRDLDENDKKKAIKAVAIGAVLELCSSIIQMIEGAEDEESAEKRNYFFDRLRKEVLPCKKEIAEGLALFSSVPAEMSALKSLEKRDFPSRKRAKKPLPSIQTKAKVKKGNRLPHKLQSRSEAFFDLKKTMDVKENTIQKEVFRRNRLET